MGQLQVILAPATELDFDTVWELIEDAQRWLRTKSTDQWTSPWPDSPAMQRRVRADLSAGKTWTAGDGGTPVATITVDPHDDGVWPPPLSAEPAVYVKRLIVNRSHHGHGLGAGLLAWAGLRARQHGARYVRAAVWTTNAGLHRYYQGLGFSRCGYSPLAGYPSAALFQRPTHVIRPGEAAALTETAPAATGDAD